VSMLRLSHASDIPAATYHTSVTESGKTESTRLALTVEPYQAPAPHALAGTGNDFNIIQSNRFIMGVILPSNAPNSLTSIGDYAFYNCSSLAGTLALPSGITSVGNYVFYGCSGFTGNFIIPSGVASAGTNAFGAAGFQPSAFRQASQHRFWRFCQLHKLHFVQCDGSNPAYLSNGGILYDNPATQIITVPLKLAGAVSISNTVTTIGGSVFGNCVYITSVSIPDSITSIGAFTFQNCIGLTSIEIPYQVKTLSMTFYNCTNLSSVTLHSGFQTIGLGVFWLTSLSSVTIPDTVASIGQQAFENCASLAGVAIAQSASGSFLTIGTSAFNECPLLTAITFPDTASSIGDSAFAAKTGGLATVIFGGSGTKVSNDNSFPMFQAGQA